MRDLTEPYYVCGYLHAERWKHDLREGGGREGGGGVKTDDG